MYFYLFFLFKFKTAVMENTFDTTKEYSRQVSTLLSLICIRASYDFFEGNSEMDAHKMLIINIYLLTNAMF